MAPIFFVGVGVEGAFYDVVLVSFGWSLSVPLVRCTCELVVFCFCKVPVIVHTPMIGMFYSSFFSLLVAIFVDC